MYLEMVKRFIIYFFVASVICIPSLAIILLSASQQIGSIQNSPLEPLKIFRCGLHHTCFRTVSHAHSMLTRLAALHRYSAATSAPPTSFPQQQSAAHTRSAACAPPAHATNSTPTPSLLPFPISTCCEYLYPYYTHR
jgi:hypothetical protein